MNRMNGWRLLQAMIRTQSPGSWSITQNAICSSIAPVHETGMSSSWTCWLLWKNRMVRNAVLTSTPYWERAWLVFGTYRPDTMFLLSPSTIVVVMWWLPVNRKEHIAWLFAERIPNSTRLDFKCISLNLKVSRFFVASSFLVSPNAFFSRASIILPYSRDRKPPPGMNEYSPKTTSSIVYYIIIRQCIFLISTFLWLYCTR